MMDKYPWMIGCLIFVFLFIQSGICIKWLSLQHSNLHWNLTSLNNNPGRGIRSGVRSPCAVAKRRYGFIKVQAKLCRNAMEAMPHVQTAAMLAADTCRIVFKDRRWNCSSITTAPYLTPDLTRATREQAFVYAISSAALTYTMARACASGSLYHCSCATKPTEPPEGTFQWGGCGDNLKWGAHFAKRFIDNAEKYVAEKAKKNVKRDNSLEENREAILKNEVAVINLHNNKVGRKVILEGLRIQCKCHGVSGSCNIKTCWKALPSIAEVGTRLLQKYTNAKEIETKAYEQHIATLKPKKISDQLLFISKSPDYCTKDERLGSLGTVGRQCNVTSNGPNSCRQLCCGRGYRTVVEEKIERCQCKYYNCCYVKCKVCRTMTQRYECS
ncbi:unnamed protein product [Brassicogethes aeneus]|uniref:Protein Wnt n=1 Tax=Brassicogethes aeneus TaxID=1431903 RepID=A0A9P0B7Y6_BRAAE|nr:unnamed protein product [Brassicogethes aeneus]